jgi:hypothetical protein
MTLAAIVSRLRASFAFRIKRYFRLAISWLFKRRIARMGAKDRNINKPLSTLRLMYFTGRDQADLLHQSLCSVMSSWSFIPRLLLVSDGSISVDELREQFSWWPTELIVMTWNHFAESAMARGRNGLAELTTRNILGRKLCAILESGLETATLFSDTDILWFKQPPLPSSVTNQQVVIKLAEDLQAMYDINLVTSLSLYELQLFPWLNTGVCFVKGDVYAQANLVGVVESAAKAPNYFSEQTILALACRRIKGPSWSLADIHLGGNDGIRWPKPSFVNQGWSARHYPGNYRHWFWVDAYFLQSKAFQNITAQ